MVHVTQTISDTKGTACCSWQANNTDPEGKRGRGRGAKQSSMHALLQVIVLLLTFNKLSVMHAITHDAAVWSNSSRSSTCR